MYIIDRKVSSGPVNCLLQTLVEKQALPSRAKFLGATLIGGALTIDEFHNWYDVFAGAVIGTIMAFSSYRMCYAAIWDWRWNHIPLNRGQAFMYTHDGVELMDALWTRKAGWGAEAMPNGGNATNSRGMFGFGAAGTGYPRKPVGSGANRRSEDIV